MIIFDEPTTALDVIVQAAVIETIKELQRETGFHRRAHHP
jgi:peptide/nickel transport system ATP-binding protein